MSRAGGGAQESLGVALARAAAGAIVFGLPLLMTMEMWWLGIYMDRLRLLLLLLVTVVLLSRLAYYSGFEETANWREDLRDALVAVGVGALVSSLILWLLGVLSPGLSWNESLGKIALETVPASIGALLAKSQFGGAGGEEGAERTHQGYRGQLFLMAVGSLFLAWNVAPTEEMVLIAYRLSAQQQLLLMGTSLLVMHGFVYGTNFAEHSGHPAEAFWSLFARYTVAGYALALLVSLYILWTLGRTDGAALSEILSAAVVLGFPASIGAAAARVLL